MPTTDPALEGPSWSTPLNITYAWGDATTQSFGNPAGTFTNAITGAYQTLVQTAMHAWEAVANVHFTLLSSTSGANIDFGWMNFTTTGQLGVTQYADYTDGSTGKDTFLSGLFVGFEDPAYRAVGSDQTSLYSGYNTTLYQIILHEIGHSLGLAHVNDPTMLMNPNLGPNDRGISASDVTNIQKIYGAPGSGTPAVPTTTASIMALSADTGASGTDFVTNVAAQTITATLSAALASGESLMGSVNGGTTWTNITAYVSGTAVTWTGVTLAGISSIALKVTNATGNGAVAYQSYVLDNAPPTTVAGGIHISNDTGSSGTDFVTNAAAQTVTATLTAVLASGEKLYGSIDGGATWTDVTGRVSGVVVSWTGVTLQAGTNAIAFRVCDLAGNYGATASQTYTLDTVAPTTGVNGLQLSADSGTNATDFVTNQAGQTVTGILGSPLAAGDKLFGSVNGGTTWTNITSKIVGTALSWNGVTLGAGTSSIQLKVVDLAGNTGAVTSQVYTLDVTPPTTAVTGIAISADGGASSSDLVTNVAPQTITATLAAGLAAGDRLYGSVDGGTTWNDVTNQVSGTSVSWTGAMLLAGTRNVAFRVVDLAGNAGPTSVRSYTLDVTPPTAAVVAPIALSNDSGIVGDFVTNVASQTISATLNGALSAGDRLLGSRDGGAAWTDVTGSISGTNVSWTGVVLNAGTGAIQFKVVDLAGNAGAVTTQAYTLKTTPPATPAAPVLAAPSDSGTPGDRVTNVTRPTITGTAPVGSTVKLYDGDGTTVLGTAVATAGIYSITTTLLAEGTHNLTVKATDYAGNVSGASPSLSITIDTMPPTATRPDLAAASDSGVAGDGVTNVLVPTFTGTGAGAGNVVRLYDTDGVTLIGTAVADGLGNYGAASVPLSQGMHSITATVTDAAGNVGAYSPALALTIDATAPTTTVSGLRLANDTGVDGDFVTTIASQTLSGTLSAPLGAGERLFGSVDGGTTWWDITATVVGTNLSWNGITLTGTNSIGLRVIDAAGNLGPTTTQGYEIDTATVVTPPVVTPAVIVTPVVTAPVVTLPVVTPIDPTPPPTSVGSPAVDPTPVQTKNQPPVVTDPTVPETASTPTDQFSASTVVNTVYRFFDSTHGTQFLTSNPAERDTIMAIRPDLAYEGKAMGSVESDPGNPNVTPVYRFFDGSNGTHFFTTSAGERDQILSTRHDMVLEQANLFEHATQQAGDVAIYRFFETTDGSHFFTSDQGEIATITQHRPDMVAEGISFYAPKI